MYKIQVHVPCEKQQYLKKMNHYITFSGFQVWFWNFEQSFCRRTKEARWLICAERRRQVWRKSAVKVTESERCELVLNAVFYWEPVSSFKSCVTRSRFDFFKMSRAALFWIFCMRAICSSATPVSYTHLRAHETA